MRMPGFIEVELGSFCNRRCGWCPNAYSERGLAKKHMAVATWEALLDDLHRCRYAGWLAFHNYNEPLADPFLLPRVRRARERLPHAKLELHTNGDLLDRTMLEALVAGGVTLIRVTLYPSNARAFEPPEPGRAERFLSRLGVPKRSQREKPSKLELGASFGDTELVVRVPRIATYSTRAGEAPLEGLRDTEQRTSPCYLPFHSAAIDWLGNLKLCCHDATLKSAAPTIIGNVAETPFSELWKGERMQALRGQLARADFEGLAFCQGCAHESPAHVKRHALPLVRQLERTNS